MPRRTVPFVAGFIAALLVAAVVGALTLGPDDGFEFSATPSLTSTTAVRRSGSTNDSVPAATTIEDVVPVLQGFVEKERGLTYKHPVKVTLLDDEKFEERVVETSAEDEKDIEHTEAALQAMGLLTDDDDLSAIVRTFTAGAVLGFYDPESKELVVRGTEPTPFVRTVLSHELLHALEDQNFDLDRDDLTDEGYAGFQTLAEGSALRIEDRYRDSLSRTDRQAADREERSLGGNVPDVPEVVEVLFGFPYAYGPDLVAAIEDAGGHARLDAAYEDPPASSEQVIDPERYLEGDKPESVPTPEADRTAFDDGEIGELFLALMLRSELEDDDARSAADGWGGDHYVVWKDGARTCMRMNFVMDTPGDTAQLAAALAEWAAGRNGNAVATGTSLRTCG